MLVRHALAILVSLIASSRSFAATLYSNGSIITDLGTGPGGGNLSQTSSDFGTGGFSCISPQRIADSFSVSGATWAVQSITVSGYITSSAGYPIPPSSPITGLIVNLWRGTPELPASTLVASSSNMISNVFSGTWRVPSGLLSNTQRPVFDLTASFNNPELPPDNYWIDFSITGNGSGTIFSPMVMSTASGISTVNGNATRKLTDTWVTLIGGTTGQGVDFPFVISGSVVVPEPTGSIAILALGGLLTRRRARER